MANVTKFRYNDVTYELGKPVDDTFTMEGYPADSKAIGELTEYKTVMSRNTIPADSDINTYTTPGVYTVTSNEIAESLLHWPNAIRGDLLVFNTIGSKTEYSYGKIQIAVTHISDMYYRRYVSNNTGWSNWVLLSNNDSVEAQYSALYNDLSDLSDNLNVLTKIEFTEASGYLGNNGLVTPAGTTTREVYTNKIAVNPGDKIRITINYQETVAMWLAYCTYSGSGALIGRTIAVSQNGKECGADIIVPDGVCYISFTYRTYGTASRNIYFLSNLLDKFIYNADLQLTNGYFNVSGGIGTQTDRVEYYTQKIDIDLASNWKWELAYGSAHDMWVAMAVYNADSKFLRRVTLYEAASVLTKDGGISFEESDKYFAICYRSFGDGQIKITGLTKNSNIADAVNLVTNDLNGIKSKNDNGFPFRFKPVYDHLFVNLSAQNIVVPHESLYHVRLSRRMGYNIIEANIQETSDGVFITNHLINGKFDRYFHHVDGATNISNIALSDVTWEWVVNNVRYNSKIPKYRTRPCRIEEFFAECKQQNIIPFVGATKSEVFDLADAYMGKDNYIAYKASRRTCPNAIIYHWVTLTTKADILDYCNSVGRPFIYGMSNPTAFTDAELEEIVSELHKNGFWIGTSYADDAWYKYQAIGFDFNGSQTLINRIDSGNICNIDSMYGFADYTVTNASETDGVLSFSTGGAITPTIQDAVYDVCGIDIEIWFSGTITLSAIGERKATTYTSDGSIPVIIAIPIINGSPKFTITCTAGTEVYDLTFKASRF